MGGTDTIHLWVIHLWVHINKGKRRKKQPYIQYVPPYVYMQDGCPHRLTPKRTAASTLYSYSFGHIIMTVACCVCVGVYMKVKACCFQNPHCVIQMLRAKLHAKNGEARTLTYPMCNKQYVCDGLTSPLELNERQYFEF